MCLLNRCSNQWDLKIKCLALAQDQIGGRPCVFCCGGPIVVSFWL